LASHQGQDIPIKHLYVEYRYWVEHTQPFRDVSVELATLARQGDDFRRIMQPQPNDVIYDLCTFLDIYDIRTAYPLLLAMLDAQLSDQEWQQISKILTSYLLRRFVCDLGTKNYNRIFLSLTRNLRRDGFTATNLKNALLTQTGESGVWPDDSAFREAWLHKPLYRTLTSPKLVYLFGRLNQTFMSSKSESIVFEQSPSIEHIMPQAWINSWPLPDGSKGMDDFDLWTASEADLRAIATRKRKTVIQTIGNLTLLSKGLNSAQSNLPWRQKQPELVKHSLLPINQELFREPEWNEETIFKRAEALFVRALTIWHR
jgi:hypothetical protein